MNGVLVGDLSREFPLGHFLVYLAEPRKFDVIDCVDQRPGILINVRKIYEVVSWFPKSCLGSLSSLYSCHEKDPQYDTEQKLVC